ncbi:uncharacterized protein LOC133898624 [Phragmites australis]|uniref:uncharacterized protein LOC133898624 n=1 Tax=Phragmites australis TaxID=29695 RepID=UPI002D78A653|nr:uncharacterized protein LOC133898624 [Phragmites australis]
MYTGSQDITRTRIGEDGDLDEAALVGLLRVVIGVEDLTRAVLPREQLALCTDPNRVALQATLPEFDTQDEATGGAPRTGDGDATSGNPQASGRGATGGRPQTDGGGAAGGKQQADRGAAAGSNHQVSRRGAAGSGAAAAPGDKGNRPWTFVPQPSSSSSPSPPRQRCRRAARRREAGASSCPVQSLRRR